MSLCRIVREEEVPLKEHQLLSFQKCIGSCKRSSALIHSFPSGFRGARVEETGVSCGSRPLRLHGNSKPPLDGEVQDRFRSSPVPINCVDPFDTKHGGIHWLTDGEPSPSVATYSWEDERLVIFFPATSTEYVYTVKAWILGISTQNRWTPVANLLKSPMKHS